MPLAEPDPVSGIAVVNLIEYVPTSAGTERVGMLTGATFAQLEEILRTIFEL